MTPEIQSLLEQGRHAEVAEILKPKVLVMVNSLSLEYEVPIDVVRACCAMLCPAHTYIRMGVAMHSAAPLKAGLMFQISVMGGMFQMTKNLGITEAKMESFLIGADKAVKKLFES